MKNYEKKVSVIMGVYNQWDEKILLKAVNSILRQTLGDFEFIIYDDGSDPVVASFVRLLAGLDERIIVIGRDENRGLAFSLNACIKRARGEYIARMDADDISLPERLEKQVRFLDAHPEYMWCGTNAYLIDKKGIWGERKMPEMPCRDDYLKFSPYIHPSVMYRANIFETMEGYNVSSETLRCEDYEIFMRFQQAGYRGYNIQEPLLQYREDEASYQRRSLTFRINEAKIRYRNFKKMGLLFPTGWIYVLRPVIAAFVPKKMLRWLKRNEQQKEQSIRIQPHIAEDANI